MTETPKLTEQDVKLLEALVCYYNSLSEGWKAFYKLTGVKPVEVKYMELQT